MSKKKLWTEWAKTLLIVLLIASAVTLCLESGYFDSPMHNLGLSTAEKNGDSSVGDSAVSTSSGALPLRMAVCLEDGRRCGLAYDRAGMEEMFQRFSASLGEALGSAGEPEEVNERVFRDAFKNEGVFFELPCAQPLGLLSDWLGAEMKNSSSAVSADMLLLSTDGDRAELLYRSESGGFFRCSTALNASALSSRIGEQTDNGAYFAFEDKHYAGLESYTVMLEQQPVHYTVSASNPLRSTEEAEVLFSVLDINTYVARQYTESDGTQVYIDGDKSLRISSGGNVLFQQDGRDSADLIAYSVSEAAELALRIGEGSLGQFSGAAKLSFVEISIRESGYDFSMDYEINGVPVRLRNGHAMEIQIRDGVVRRVEMNFRNFAVSEDEAGILPMRYAAAIVAAGDGGSLKLRYSESGDEITYGWVSD